MKKLIIVLSIICTLLLNGAITPYDNVHLCTSSPRITEFHDKFNIRKIELYKKILYTTNWTSNSRDSLKHYLDPIFIPIIEKYTHKYSMSVDELVACIETIATSESGTSKGQPFSNELFRKHNNPFGIKGNGTIVTTIEYYDGIPTVIVDGFAHFDLLEDAINYLVGTLFMTERYTKLRSACTYKEFFCQLKECGYFTHPTWHKDYFIPTCEKYYYTHCNIKL